MLDDRPKETAFDYMDGITNALYELNTYIGGVRNLTISASNNDNNELCITTGEFAMLLAVALERTQQIQQDVDAFYPMALQQEKALKAVKNKGSVQ